MGKVGGVGWVRPHPPSPYESWNSAHCGKIETDKDYSEIVWNFSRFYFHFRLPCFILNCHQNARIAVLDKLFFHNFPGEDTPRPPYEIASAALAISPRGVSRHLPIRNTFYGPVFP